jgi:activator of HSP90 ATPase
LFERQGFFFLLTIFSKIRVNKNCLKWAQNWFTEQLVGLEAEKDGNKASITKMVECTGDVDLNQRKGKIITIFDVVLKLNWKGRKKNETF